MALLAENFKRTAMYPLGARGYADTRKVIVQNCIVIEKFVGYNFVF